jgi:hypothetical protein
VFETWPFTLNDKNGMKALNCVYLRKICGPNEEKLVGKWRKLRNVELRDLKSLSDFGRMTKSRKMGGACGTYGGN